MKKLLTLFMAITCTSAIFAYDCKIDGIYYNLNNETMTAEVTNETGDAEARSYSGSIVIPSLIYFEAKGYSVTTIGSRAFFFCSGLTSITIPNSVTTIERSAFAYCEDLKSITIPHSVTTIGNGAFTDCFKLTSVIIPNFVTKIGEDAFSWCKGLTSITIPNSVTTIGKSAFAYCEGLKSITIPNSVTTIGSSAFCGCKGLTSVTIPNSVTKIGDGPFEGCSALKSINIGAANTRYCSIDGVLFNYTRDTLIQYPIGNTRTEYTIPNSVTTIGSSAFAYCSSISITIVNPNVKVEEDAFEANFSDLYCGESVDLSKSGAKIEYVHRLSEEELATILPLDQYIKGFVESQINEWQKKGEFEKTSDWQKRVTEVTRKQKIDALVRDAKKIYLAGYKKKNNPTFSLGTYDADNEVYLVKGNGGEDLLVAVPIADASYVKQNWASHTASPQYDIQGTDVVIVSVDFTFPNNKTYTYKPNQQLTYSTPDIKYNFNPIEFPDLQTVTMGGAAAAQPQAVQYVSSIIVTKPFDLTPMSSVLVSYKNIFGKYEMPDLDVPFPFVVIRVKLEGTPNLIRLAKQSLSLDLGQSYIVEQTVPQDDKILFLVSTGVRNIYLTDGNGQRQLLYSGRLQPNTIYDGTVEVK